MLFFFVVAHCQSREPRAWRTWKILDTLDSGEFTLSHIISLVYKIWFPVCVYYYEKNCPCFFLQFCTHSLVVQCSIFFYIINKTSRPRQRHEIFFYDFLLSSLLLFKFIFLQFCFFVVLVPQTKKNCKFYLSSMFYVYIQFAIIFEYRMKLLCERNACHAIDVIYIFCSNEKS